MFLDIEFQMRFFQKARNVIKILLNIWKHIWSGIIYSQNISQGLEETSHPKQQQII